MLFDSNSQILFHNLLSLQNPMILKLLEAPSSKFVPGNMHWKFTNTYDHHFTAMFVQYIPSPRQLNT